MKTLDLKLRVWRQADPSATGAMVEYDVSDVSEDMSFLEMLDPRTGHVHVANELRTPFPGAEIEVRIRDWRWAFGGDLAADSLAYVGRVEIPAGAARIDVVLRQDGLGEVANGYGPVLLGAVPVNGGRPAAGS